MRPSNLRTCFIFVFFALCGISAQAVPLAIVSVPDQRIAVVENGFTVARFPVSTSKYGVGDSYNSFATPQGYMEIAGKIGEGAPLGAVFHHRHMTGEILRPNAPGRDPIVTRILWLRGLEPRNANAFSRNIYIHGTAAESQIGTPASFGCIRMKSKDVIKFFDLMPVGAMVQVSNDPLTHAIAAATQFPHIALSIPATPRFAANSPRF